MLVLRLTKFHITELETMVETEKKERERECNANEVSGHFIK